MMKILLVTIGWCILFVLAWPLALLVLLLWPIVVTIVWLLSLPFRALGIAVDAVFALLKSILFLPARILGYRSADSGA